MIPAPDANDPTLGEAAAALARAEAEEGLSSPAEARAADPATDSGEQATEPASGATEEGVKTADSEPAAGTPATEEQQTTKDSTEQKTAQPKDPATGKFVKESRYEKAKGRLGKEFEEAKAIKAEALKLQETLRSERAAFERQQQEFRAAQQKASQPKYKPEDYENHATQLEDQAQKAEALAKKVSDDLEAKGEYDQAEKRLERGRQEAAEHRTMAKRARAYAAELRANPPKAPETDQQAAAKAEATLEASRKEWLTKAAQDFPATAKADTAEGKALREFVEQNRVLVLGPDGKVKDPQAIYYAARLVTAETSAVRVPAMEKELAGLRAKVKELNEKLSISADDIGGGNLSQRKFEDMSEAEQEAQLRAEAAQRDR